MQEAPAWERYEHRSIDLLLSVEFSYTRPHHLWDMLVLAITQRTDPMTVTTPVSISELTQGTSVEIPVHILARTERKRRNQARRAEPAAQSNAYRHSYSRTDKRTAKSS